MTQVTAVDAYWLGVYFSWQMLDGVIDFGLAELGSVFYSVKEKNFDERGNRRTADREFSKRAEIETEMARQREEYVFPSSVDYAPCLLCVLLVGQRERQRKRPWLSRRLADLARGL